MLGLLFQNQILCLFGGNPNEGLNASIRNDGSPKYAMFATLVGAISNIILDPIFIFGFQMSVSGAALATIIGQILTFILSILYLRKAKSFEINKESIKLNKEVVEKILGSKIWLYYSC